MSIIDTLITDRTQADVEALKALYAKPKATWTAAEWDSFLLANHKGAYNASDFNRVQDSMFYIIEHLRALGIKIDGIVELPVFSVGQLPTESAFPPYFANVARMREVLAQYAEPLDVPSDIQSITPELANNIETTLIRIETLLQRMKLSWFYCGEILCGEV